MVAIKTAVGLTDRINVPTVVQQGRTLGPILCSNSIVTIGKKCRNMSKHYYLYKKSVRIFSLAFVDDLGGNAEVNHCHSIPLSTLTKSYGFIQQM